MPPPTCTEGCQPTATPADAATPDTSQLRAPSAPTNSTPPGAHSTPNAPPSSSTRITNSCQSPDWSRVRLGVDAAPVMFVAHWSADEAQWDGGALLPYGPLSLLPAAQVLNYGQSIFEGLKAYRRDGGTDSDTQNEVLLFRPGDNASRFAAGAARMCMPPVPPPMFLGALHAVARANAEWVPPPSRGSLYLRPLLLGTGSLLGILPSTSYTFVVYAVPVGSRAKSGRLTAMDFLVHDSLHRAAPRGVGSTKAAGNYSPCLLAQKHAREAGCHDCVYLDAKSDTFLEEGSGCNVFVAHGSVLTTPPAAGSILPGITRASLLQLAAALGYGVQEAPLTVQQAMQADEMFASGTAMVVQPIGSLSFKGTRVAFTGGAPSSAASACGSPVSSPVTSSTTVKPTSGTLVSQSNHNSVPVAEAETAAAEAGAAADSAAAAAAARNGVVPAGAGGAATATASLGADGDDGSDPWDPRGGRPRDEGGGGRPGGSSGSDVAGNTQCVGVYGSSSGCSVYDKAFAAVNLTAAQRTALAAAAAVPDLASLPPGVGPIAARLYGLLTSIQYGRVSDPFGWMVPVEMEGPTEGPLHLDRLPGLMDEQLLLPGSGGVYDRDGAAKEGGGDKGKLAAGAGKGKLVPRSVFADPNLE